MKLLTLAPALALASLALVAPPQARAEHRHGRGCGHERGYHADRGPAGYYGYDDSYGYYGRAPRYDRSPAPYYRSRSYSGGYGYGYGGYWSHPYPSYYGYPAYPPPPRYHYRRHRGPRIGFFLRF